MLPLSLAISRARRAVIAAVILCALTSTAYVHAQERALKTDTVDKLDAVLLLDSSGSMLQTDPHRLREEGAKLFVQFLHPGDRIAIMQFDRDAKVIRPFTDFKPEDLQSISADIGKIVPAGIYTDLLTGITAAGELLKQQKRPDANGAIILLSDGKMEPDPAIGYASSRTEELLNTVLPGLKAAGLKVDTLAFSPESDRKQLSEIALATDGTAWFTPDAEKIHESFANLFLAVKKPQLLPLSSKGFTIDPQISEATFYVNRGDGNEVSLTTPKGKSIKFGELGDHVKWFRGQKFDVITISSPEAGSWKIDGLVSSDDFATVLTNLKLVTDWPAAVTSEEPTLLQARLNDGDKPVALKEMSGATRYGIQIIPSDRVAEPILEDVLYDDGTHGDKIAGDGIFSYKTSIATAGEYKVMIVAKGPTFDRRQQIPFRVKPPVIALSLTNEAGEQLHAGGAAGQAKSSPPALEKEAKEDAKPEVSAGERSPQKSESKEKTDEKTEPKIAPSEKPKKEESKEESRARALIHGSAGDRIAIELSPDVSAYKNIEVQLIATDAQRGRFIIPLEPASDGLHYSAAQSVLPHAGLFELKATLTAETKKKVPVKEESQQVQYNNPKGEETGSAVEVVVKTKAAAEPAQSSPSGVPQALIIVLVNLGIGGFLTWTLKKARSGGASAMPVFTPADAALAAVAAIEARKALTEISLDDKIFDNEVILPPMPEALAALETSAAAPHAENETAKGATETPEDHKGEG